MKIVLDTNVLIAAFLSRGLCSEIFEHCLEYHELVLSDYLLEEVQRNLLWKLGQSRADVSKVVGILSARAIKVTPQTLLKKVCPDPTDDPILGTALAGNAEYLVTGDKELLAIKQYGRLRIISPVSFGAFSSIPINPNPLFAL